MSKHDVLFDYKASGTIEVEAADYDEACEKAEAILNDMRNTGSIMDNNGRINWNGDEVEVS